MNDFPETTKYLRCLERERDELKAEVDLLREQLKAAMEEKLYKLVPWNAYNKNFYVLSLQWASVEFKLRQFAEAEAHAYAAERGLTLLEEGKP